MAVRARTSAAADSGAAGLYPPFEEALARARSLNLSSQSEWRAWCQVSANVTADGTSTLPLPKRPDRVYKESGWLGIGHWLTAPDTPAKRRRTGSHTATPARQRQQLHTPTTPQTATYVCAVCRKKESPRPVTHRARTVGDGVGDSFLRDAVEQHAGHLKEAIGSAEEHDRTHPPAPGDQTLAKYCLKYVATSIKGLQVAGARGRGTPKDPPTAAAVVQAFVGVGRNRREAAAAASQPEPWRTTWPRPSMGALQAGYLYKAFALYYASGAYHRHMQTGGSSDSKWMPKPLIIQLCRYDACTRGATVCVSPLVPLAALPTLRFTMPLLCRVRVRPQQNQHDAWDGGHGGQNQAVRPVEGLFAARQSSHEGAGAVARTHSPQAVPRAACGAPCSRRAAAEGLAMI